MSMIRRLIINMNIILVLAVLCLLFFVDNSTPNNYYFVGAATTTAASSTRQQQQQQQQKDDEEDDDTTTIMKNDDSNNHKLLSLDDDIDVIEMSGVTLYKLSSRKPIQQQYQEGPHRSLLLPDNNFFPGIIPAQFIQKAWNINVVETNGGKQIMERYINETNNNNNSKDKKSTTCAANITDDNEEQEQQQQQQLLLLFGSSLLSRAREMFMERNLLHELSEFLETGVSNPNAGYRSMHWVGIEIHPNKSLALHSHPNIEFAYVVQGTMHEWRLIVDNDEDDDDPNNNNIIPYYHKKTVYDKDHLIGPNLTNIDANDGTSFKHNTYVEGEMFINAIGDVHQSFTKHEGLKLFALWGDGNADVPKNLMPQNSKGFFNQQSAQAWD